MSSDTTALMSQPDTADGRQGGLSLTNLPGEIRNMIYDYVIKDCIVFLRHRHRVRGFPSLLPVPWAKLKRQGLGLTQVCRQIRQESLPLHRHRVRPLIIHKPFLHDYISSLFPNEADACGALVLWHNELPGIDFQVDLIPLIQIATSARDLDIEFVFGRGHPSYCRNKEGYVMEKVNIMEKFFDPRNKEGLKRAAKICTDITFVLRAGRYVTSVKVRNEYAEPWMTPATRCGFGEPNIPKALEWLRGIGLVQDDMERFRRDNVIIQAEYIRGLG